jgi:uncharacterized protein
LTFLQTSEITMPKSPSIPDRISLQQARNLSLAAQGMLQRSEKKATKADVLKAIRRMHLLQIDTIHVIARSPYLVLWSRLGDYPPAWLDELLEEGKLFEHWAHAYCFIPIEDYPLHRRRAVDTSQVKKWPIGWAVKLLKENPPHVERVRRHLLENGSVRSAEFENTERVPGGWWNWKAEKDVLEAMLLTGEVMVARRQNFQRVYDLRERVLPGWSDEDLPSHEECQREFDLRSVKAVGIAVPSWVPDYFRQPKNGTEARLEALAARGMIHPVEVEGMKERAYVHRDHLNLLRKAASDGLEPGQTILLSPFDPLIWDRKRLSQLFGFDYQIECYTPAAKRKYGYFTLPILHQGKIVGRLDPKAHRDKGVFEVRTIHLEPGVAVDEALVTGLADVLRRLATWHGTPELVIGSSNPTQFAGLLREALKE